MRTKDEKTVSLNVAVSTADNVRAIADTVGASPAEFLRVTMGESLQMQAVYLDGLARKVDVQRREIRKRMEASARRSAPPAPAPDPAPAIGDSPPAQPAGSAAPAGQQPEPARAGQPPNRPAQAAQSRPKPSTRPAA